MMKGECEEKTKEMKRANEKSTFQFSFICLMWHVAYTLDTNEFNYVDLIDNIKIANTKKIQIAITAR